MIEIYTRASCPRCVELKEAMDKNGLPYTELDVDDPAMKERIRKNFPGAKLLPILAVRSTEIGGIDELLVLVQNDQLQYLP